jgi:hypothetical protein
VNLPPRLTKSATAYDVQPGDELVRVIDVRPEHRGALFEARDETGEGLLGRLADVTTFHLDGQAIVRFEGMQQGLLADLDALLVMRPQVYERPIE